MCPCGSGQTFETCCGPLLTGDRPAESAEQLMRSRYTAYTRGDFDYIFNTTDPQRRYDFDHAATRDWMKNSVFCELKILAAKEEGNKAVVEFVARFHPQGHPDHLENHHEVSRFRKQGGVWYFREGKSHSNCSH